MNKHILYGVMALALGCSTVACNDDDVDVYTSPILSEVVTGDSATTATTATITGIARDLSSQNAEAYTVGVVYSTTPDPTAGGTMQAGAMGEDGNFVTTITGLQEGRTYYYAACVSLQNRLSYYGDIKSFVTTSGKAGTAEAASLTATGAVLGGTLNGVNDLIEAGTLDYGVVLSATPDGIASSKVRISAEGSTNSFTVTANKLVPNTTYHYAAYMVVGGEEIFGNTMSLTTPMLCDASQESADDYVDMGTKVEWCRYNVGAAAEGEAGALLGFGDVTGLNRSLSTADYATGNIIGTPADPAASAGMGQLPSAADFRELLSVSDMANETVNGVACVKFTSKKTGNSVYFPMAGIRDNGEEVSAGMLGLYATGESYSDQPDYAHALRLADGSTGSVELASRATAMSVRPVRKPYSNVLTVDNSKIAWGDMEGNGRLRIEIFNAYGSTAANPPMDMGRLSFDKSMFVTFRLTGVTDNLVESAAGSYKAGLQFAAGGWWPDRWSGYANEKYDCIVTGDGTYTVWMEAAGSANGAEVFCVDIVGLSNDLADKDKVKAEIVGIALDPVKSPVQSIPVDNAKVVFNNKDGNGVDGRIEIYNEYGETKVLGADFGSMRFPAGAMTVTFTIEGLGEALGGSASNDYKADLSFADASWDPSYWGGQAGSVQVTGDGTYSVQAHLAGECEGAVVWCVELYGLWSDLADSSKVKVKIENVTVPAFTE